MQTFLRRAGLVRGRVFEMRHRQSMLSIVPELSVIRVLGLASAYAGWEA